jgi:lincosamide nucleotidyltransferase A/C/D/E
MVLEGTVGPKCGLYPSPCEQPLTHWNDVGGVPALMTWREALRRAGRAVHAFVTRHRVLWVPAGWLSRFVTSAPESSPIRSVLGPLRDGLRGAMRSQDVLKLVQALEAAGVPYFLAGGWGVDALLGRSSRSHDDLDVVIDDYDEHLQRAVDALAPLGFTLVASYERRAWMSKNSVLQDQTGRQVDVDSLNWDVLAREFGPPGSDASDRQQFTDRVFTEGTVEGRQVPCLSADVQLLFHLLFELTPSQQHDVELLQHELGASVPESP